MTVPNVCRERSGTVGTVALFNEINDIRFPGTVFFGPSQVIDFIDEITVPTVPLLYKRKPKGVFAFLESKRHGSLI